MTTQYVTLTPYTGKGLQVYQGFREGEEGEGVMPPSGTSPRAETPRSNRRPHKGGVTFMDLMPPDCDGKPITERVPAILPVTTALWAIGAHTRPWLRPPPAVTTYTNHQTTGPESLTACIIVAMTLMNHLISLPP